MSSRPGGCSALEPSRQDGQAWSGRQGSDHKQGQQSVSNTAVLGGLRGSRPKHLPECRTECRGEVRRGSIVEAGLFCTRRLTQLLLSTGDTAFRLGTSAYNTLGSSLFSLNFPSCKMGLRTSSGGGSHGAKGRRKPYKHQGSFILPKRLGATIWPTLKSRNVHESNYRAGL